MGVQQLDGLMHSIDRQQVWRRLHILLLLAQLPDVGFHRLAPHPETGWRQRQAVLKDKARAASRARNNERPQWHCRGGVHVLCIIRLSERDQEGQLPLQIVIDVISIKQSLFSAHPCEKHMRRVSLWCVSIKKGCAVPMGATESRWSFNSPLSVASCSAPSRSPLQRWRYTTESKCPASRWPSSRKHRERMGQGERGWKERNR